MNPDPFGVLGLPARPGLTDDEVRAAWRRVAAATHPDRTDGGDPARFAAAAAAYTELRTSYGRGEAYADLTAGRRRHSPGTRAMPPPAPRPPGAPTAPAPGSASREAHGRTARGRAGPVRVLAARIGRGRPAVLGLRLAITAGVITVAFLVTGVQPAAAGLATGAVTWFLLTARHDLAPPR